MVCRSTCVVRRDGVGARRRSGLAESEAMGSVRLKPLGLLGQPGSRTTMGVSHRAGDTRSRIHVLHRQRQGEGQWHAGVSLARFGDRNVPQDRFTYVGRVLDIEDGRLANTGGRGGHAVLGARWENSERGQFSVDLRASDVLQGLFPGIIGVPSQSEIQGDGDRFSVDIPSQKARRIQLAGMDPPGHFDSTVRVSLSRNLRIESAPPHAHGYGPEPDSDLSLQLDERHVFVESRWEGIHGAFGFQVEHLDGRTSGWEFLLPDHLRSRMSAIADRKWKAGRIGLRIDGVSVSNVDHTEPLYASDGAVVGDDVRATALDRLMAGWALMLNQPFHLGQRLEGQWTATVYSRVPDSYSLSANGIHHGTFRFEQGNPDLAPEKTAEFRATIGSHDPAEDHRFRWSARGFAALHDGFIHLTPTFPLRPSSMRARSTPSPRSTPSGREAKSRLMCGLTAAGCPPPLPCWASGRSRRGLDCRSLNRRKSATRSGGHWGTRRSSVPATAGLPRPT